MNIDELEKLARAAKHDNDSLIVGPSSILELIEQHKSMKEALGDMVRELVLSDVELDYIESHFRKWINKGYEALARANGESNETPDR